jgi:Chaperone of endosialidase
VGVASDGVLKLRPVTFRYKPEHDDGARLAQYGLIAEEVAEIYPELVTTNAQGEPTGVRYHVLPAMLLNELQRQQRQLAAHVTREREQAVRLDTQAARLDAQQQELDELRAQVRALIGGRAAVRD